MLDIAQATTTTTVLTRTANPQRLQAIATTDDPLLIIAGPGFGKTFTLVERIVRLITTRGVIPKQFMAVTFTEKTAQELITRIANCLAEIGLSFNLNEMCLGAFHSTCLRWLQDHREHTRLRHSFSMIDDFDQHYFLYQRLVEYEALPGGKCISGELKKPKPNSNTDDGRDSDSAHTWQLNAWNRSKTQQTWVNMVAEESLDPRCPHRQRRRGNQGARSLRPALPQADRHRQRARGLRHPVRGLRPPA